jgi:GntR family transcriptional regulator, transcriptional repressor for pyruvate dehydrogenase complex
VPVQMAAGAAHGGPPVRRTKAAVVVARRIVEQIVEGGLRDGDPLPNESAMLRDLGVGRPALREALRLLETQGMLRMKPGPGGGPVVRRPDPGDLAGAMTLLLETLHARWGEALVAWAALEPAVAGLAARHARDDQIDGLERQVARMDEAVGTADFYRENAAFHALLAESSGNTVVLVVLEAIARVTAEAGAGIHLPRSFRATLVQHARALVAEVSNRDAVAATAVMTRTMGDWQEFMSSHYAAVESTPIRWSPISD